MHGLLDPSLARFQPPAGFGHAQANVKARQTRSGGVERALAAVQVYTQKIAQAVVEFVDALHSAAQIAMQARGVKFDGVETAGGERQRQSRRLPQLSFAGVQAVDKALAR